VQAIGAARIDDKIIPVSGEFPGTGFAEAGSGACYEGDF
jgi:hypothetical protein